MDVSGIYEDSKSLSRDRRGEFGQFELQHVELLFGAKEWNLSAKAARYLVAVHPTSRLLFILATSLYHLGEDDEAIQFYFRYVSIEKGINDDLFFALKNLGNIFLRSGDLEAAEEWYAKAQRTCPHSDTLLVNLGVLSTQKRDYNSALQNYREAVTINPQNDCGWVGLALIHKELGDFELARANLHQALDLNPKNEVALQLRALLPGMY